MFPPLNWSFLGFAALVPWLVAVSCARRPRPVYVFSYLLGVLFFLVNIRWMCPVTIPGYIAMCLYYGGFFPLAAWPIRHMYRRHRVSIAMTAPIVWTAIEYLRSIGPLGFPWCLLGHTQYRFLWLIQISDLVGAYGVTFVVAMINGWLADLVVQPFMILRKESVSPAHAVGDSINSQASESFHSIARLPVGTLGTALVILACLAYGAVQASPRFFQEGPKVALVQHDFPMYVDEFRAGRTKNETILNAYVSLATQAAADHPDLIVLPETATQGCINEEFLTATPAQLQEILQRRYPKNFPLWYLKYQQQTGTRVLAAFTQLATQTNAAIVLGSLAMEWRPTAVPPRAEAFNSSFLLLPGQSKPVARYDKRHLVLFGEYVPFRTSWRGLYEWLNSLSPWGAGGRDYSLAPGEAYHVFEVDAAEPATTTTSSPTSSPSGRRYRLGTPICYEEIMPHVARDFTSDSGRAHDRKNIDILVAISNDGWFMHTAELEQHLAGAVFRAVENRIAVTRSVNTGASAIIDPNGHIRLRASLSPEKAARLPALKTALEKLRVSGEALDRAADNAATYAAATNETRQAINSDVQNAAFDLGPEFIFIHERLTSLLANTLGATPQDRRSGLAAFRDQISEDAATVDRWSIRPDTAPAICVGHAQCDARMTLYSKWGDWFAQAVLSLMIMILLDWLLRRLRGILHPDESLLTDSSDTK
jgi:apolipoprotein N-acyltransferase